MQYFDAAAIRERLPWPRMLAALDAMLHDDVAAPLRSHHSIEVPGRADGIAAADARVAHRAADRRQARHGVSRQCASRAERGRRGLRAVRCRATATALALFDGEEITACRTAGASAYAASRLARADARHLVIVGSGRIARELADAHRFIRPIERVSVWSRTIDHARAAAAELTREGVPASAVADLEARGARGRHRFLRDAVDRAPRPRRMACRRACISISSERFAPTCAKPTMPRWRART